jgi:hypothetical protein
MPQVHTYIHYMPHVHTYIHYMYHQVHTYIHYINLTQSNHYIFKGEGFSV